MLPTWGRNRAERKILMSFGASFTCYTGIRNSSPYSQIHKSCQKNGIINWRSRWRCVGAGYAVAFGQKHFVLNASVKCCMQMWWFDPEIRGNMDKGSQDLGIGGEKRTWCMAPGWCTLFGSPAVRNGSWIFNGYCFCSHKGRAINYGEFKLNQFHF